MHGKSVLSAHVVNSNISVLISAATYYDYSVSTLLDSQYMDTIALSLHNSIDRYLYFDMTSILGSSCLDN